jgi:hypothetical protein
VSATRQAPVRAANAAWPAVSSFLSGHWRRRVSAGVCEFRARVAAARSCAPGAHPRRRWCCGAVALSLRPPRWDHRILVTACAQSVAALAHRQHALPCCALCYVPVAARAEPVAARAQRQRGGEGGVDCWRSRARGPRPRRATC